MPAFHYSELAITGAKSLMWRGETLVDCIRGQDTYELDGSHAPGRIIYAYPFDAVAQSPSGAFSVLYESRGTKGIVLRGQQMLREINRSYYNACNYDYPLALFALPDGREALAHCPENYNQLEIDLLETGERLTLRSPGSHEPEDFFHSGLAADSTGQWIMSAGWVWHPFCAVSIFPVAGALQDPSILDRSSAVYRPSVEITSAVFLGDDRVILASDPEADDFDDDHEPDELRPGHYGVFKLGGDVGAPEFGAPLEGPAGRLLVVDQSHVLALYGHPRLIHLETGQVIDRWPEISSGSWASCVGVTRPNEPPIAWDPVGKRLAVASENRIQVLTLAGS